MALLSRAYCLFSLHHKDRKALHKKVRVALHKKFRVALHSTVRMAPLRATPLQPHTAFSEKTPQAHHHSMLVCITLLCCLLAFLSEADALSKPAWRELICTVSS